MTDISKEIIKRMKMLSDEKEARHLMRFFKTGAGEYGEGDRFLGIRVPASRAIAKDFFGKVSKTDIVDLIKSPWHEIRLVGFLLLVDLYKKKKRKRDNSEENIVNLYLKLISQGNNWDLVDLIAPPILGDYILNNIEKESILDSLATMNGQLWHQRVAIVSTFALIRGGIYKPTIRIAGKLLTHPHDLIHKATGWMLRETGKRGGMKEMLAFLDAHAAIMPRTMLRYAVERLSEPQRKFYMSQKTLKRDQK